LVLWARRAIGAAAAAGCDYSPVPRCSSPGLVAACRAACLHPRNHHGRATFRRWLPSRWHALAAFSSLSPTASRTAGRTAGALVLSFTSGGLLVLQLGTDGSFCGHILHGHGPIFTARVFLALVVRAGLRRHAHLFLCLLWLGRVTLAVFRATRWRVAMPKPLRRFFALLRALLVAEIQLTGARACHCSSRAVPDRRRVTALVSYVRHPAWNVWLLAAPLVGAPGHCR